MQYNILWQYFEIAINKAMFRTIVDILLSGVISYDINTVLKTIVRSKYITFTEINGMMQKSTYGVNDSANKPVPIKDLRRFSLSGTAAQKLCLLRTLPYVIGHKVPEKSKVWKILVLCNEICDICLAPAIEEDQLPYLADRIEEHNDLYAEFSKTFPPKFHYLVHYPTMIRKYGPVR